MRRVLRIGLSLCASTGPIFFSGHFFMGPILCDTISWCAGPIQKAGANMGPAFSQPLSLTSHCIEITRGKGSIPEGPQFAAREAPASGAWAGFSGFCVPAHVR
jgi:hypothetical protein